MNIMPVNSVSFKSFLPRESIAQDGDRTRDYWNDFAEECAKNPEQKEKLDTLLHELANNGDKNILALETTKGMTDAFQDNYYFRLYANNDDLIADRKEDSFTSQNRDLSKRVWIQPYNDEYSAYNYVELEGDLDIGVKRSPLDRGQFFKAGCSIATGLLYCLEKIVRDPQKRMFDLKNIEPSKYLKQFRLTV